VSDSRSPQSTQAASTRALFATNKNGNKIPLKLGDKPVKNGRIVPLASIRVKEIDRHLLDAFGPVLPDDDAGRDDVMIVLSHIAYKKAKDREWLMGDWIDRRAPWLRGQERPDFISKAMANPMLYRADTLAAALGLLYVDRQRLAITTIGAIDVPAEERQELRKERDKNRKRRARRKAGSVSREEYESNSVTAQAEAEGICTKTWYRRQKRHYAADGPGTPSKSHYAADGPGTPAPMSQVRLQHTVLIAADGPGTSARCVVSMDEVEREITISNVTTGLKYTSLQDVMETSAAVGAALSLGATEDALLRLRNGGNSSQLFRSDLNRCYSSGITAHSS
jgi:hypothetical protein